jgi:hypothetical protein
MNSTNKSYRFFALTMAFLMFYSSVGFSIDIHYCQGKLKSFSLFGKAKTCYEMTKAVKTSPQCQKLREQQSNDSCSISKKNCCENNTLHFQSDQDQQVQATEFIVNQQLQQFIVAYIVVFFQNNFTEKNASTLAFYKSPLIPRDIPVLFEAFLI